MRRKPPRLGPADLAEAIRLEADGVYQRDIGAHLGVSQSTVCRALRPVERDRTEPIAPNRGPSSRLRSRLPDPSATDEPYTDDEGEYLAAVAKWQKRTDTRFPTACDYRQVLLSLGYRKAPVIDTAPTTPLPTGQPRVPTMTVDRAVEVDTTFMVLGAATIPVIFGDMPPIAFPVRIDEPGIYRFRITLELMESTEVNP